MHQPRQIIADNLARVRDEIAAAAEAAGRPADSVRLIGVSKYVDAATTALLWEAGCTDLGESRPQQLWDKASDPALSRARWHLVGHLQRNKVRRTLAYHPIIHSVDSVRLIDAIGREADDADATVDVLLEVNCSGEAAKHGFAPDELAAALDRLAERPRVRAAGLMTMAAGDGDLTTAAANFAALRQLRDELQGDCPPGVDLRELSMGMSGDFAVAVAEGATMVRVGSRLFAGLS